MYPYQQEGHGLMERARHAAFQARDRYLPNVPICSMDVDDMIQGAALAMAQAEAEGRQEHYVWQAGRLEALMEWKRLLGRNPDPGYWVPLTDGREFHLAIEPAEERGLDWASDEDLLTLFLPVSASRDSAMLAIRILRLVAQGLDNEAIAHHTGLTVNGVAARRCRIRARLREICEERGIPPPEIGTGNGNGGWQPWHRKTAKR